MTTISIAKTLSKNDAGVDSTKEHGILIPKHPDFQSFFPELDASKVNPKITFQCEDLKDGTLYDLNYTYYNNTKNEYRLTRAKKFLRQRDAVEGSILKISKTATGKYYIDLITETEAEAEAEAEAAALKELSAELPIVDDDNPVVPAGSEPEARKSGARRGWLNSFTATWTIVKSGA